MNRSMSAVAEVEAGTLAERRAELTVANAVWVAMALLHRGSPEREGFTADEIVELVRKLRLTGGREDSVRQHIRQHCVANKRPQPNTWCMLFDPGNGLRRLFCAGDTVYPGRNAERTHPKWEELPAEFKDLREWYEQKWNRSSGDPVVDPLLALIGTWKEEPADEYVARLREGWGEGR
jgi:hypothetical protein